MRAQNLLPLILLYLSSAPAWAWTSFAHEKNSGYVIAYEADSKAEARRLALKDCQAAQRVTDCYVSDGGVGVYTVVRGINFATKVVTVVFSTAPTPKESLESGMSACQTEAHADVCLLTLVGWDSRRFFVEARDASGQAFPNVNDADLELARNDVLDRCRRMSDQGQTCEIAIEKTAPVQVGVFKADGVRRTAHRTGQIVDETLFKEALVAELREAYGDDRANILEILTTIDPTKPPAGMAEVEAQAKAGSERFMKIKP